MCFSAGASFGASAVLGLIGIVAIKKAKTTPQRLFALIPLFFSFQQLSEGMLWISLKDQGFTAWRSASAYLFLFFAKVAWPVWIPLTIWLLEKDPKRKKVLSILLGTGILVSAFLLCSLLIFDLQVISTHHHLHYRFDFPDGIRGITWIFSIFYLVVTVAPAFISGIERMKWLGLSFIVSYLVSQIFFGGFVVSTWCYFAAI